MRTEKFHERLIRLRRKKGMSVTQLASAIGVSPSTYRAWEYGRSIQGCEPFLQLSKGLEVSLIQLLAGCEEPVTVPLQKLEHAENLIQEAKLALLSL